MARGAAQPDYAGPRQQWTRPGFILSAVFMALVVVIGLVIALSSGDRNGAASSATDPNVSSNAAGPPSGVEPTGIEPTGAVPSGVPTLAPAGVKWQLFGQVALPFSGSAGPYRFTDTVATGYAHVPLGALLAATQLMVRSGFSSGRAVWEPTITEQFVPSADRDRLLAAMRAEPPQAAGPGELAQIAGFLYQSYSADTAVIGLVLRAPGRANAFVIVTTTLQWRDGDWRMVPPPGGTWSSLSRSATNLAGVIEWGAV